MEQNVAELTADEVDRLGAEGTPRAVATLIASLSREDFPLKEQVLKTLSNINTCQVYKGILAAFEKSGGSIRDELCRLAAKLELVPVLMKRTVTWRHDPEQFGSLAAALGILGHIGGEQVVEPTAAFLYHAERDIVKAALGSLRAIGCPACQKHLYSPLKLADEEICMEILDLIRTFKDRASILPMLYAMETMRPALHTKVVQFFKLFSPTELEEILDNHLDKNDHTLCRAALTMFELSGYLESARKFRCRFRFTDSIAPVTGLPAEDLSVQIVQKGTFSLLLLAGVLDVYTLPTLVRMLEKQIPLGQVNILAIFNKVKAIDIQSLRYIGTLVDKLALFNGTLKVVGMHAVGEELRKQYMFTAEYYADLPSAIKSFSLASRDEKLVIFDGKLVQPGNAIELNVFAGIRKLTRRTKIKSLEKDKVILEWVSDGPEDVFKEFLNPSIKLILVRDDKVVAFESTVIDQSFFPEQFIVISRPDMGDIIERRRHVRIPVDVPIGFLHCIDSKNIRKDLEGRTGNVSVSGMMLLSKEPLPVNNVIISSFKGDNRLNGLHVMGKIVRIAKSHAGEEQVYEYGIEFISMKQPIREKLARFVYDSVISKHESSIKEAVPEGSCHSSG